MKQLIGIGKIAICGIIATILLSSIVYANEGAKSESKAMADAGANDGGEATSLVNAVVSTFPDGNGYITTADANVDLKAIGHSSAFGSAFGEGTSPADPNGNKANAGVEIVGGAVANNDISSAEFSGIATAFASTEGKKAAYVDLEFNTTGDAEANGFGFAWADIIK